MGGFVIMDTIEARWKRLYPHILAFGPNDDLPRPAVLLFHGCGGVRDHLRRYTLAAARAGFRAFLIDSFGPRGWSRQFAATTVCTGLHFRGYERAGDIMAALWGIRQWPGVDKNRIALAGWSHGAWGIMDLMTMPLERAGEAGLANPRPDDLEALKSVFLVYPYVGFLARSRSNLWVRSPRTFGVIARKDHLGGVRTHMRCYASAVAAGADVEIWTVDATHAFDEPGIKPPTPMMYDAELASEAIDKFEQFLVSAL